MKDEEAELSVSGMTCDHCVQTVEKAIRALTGVSQVRVALDEQKAFVQFSADQISLDTIKKAVKDAGYEVDV